MRPTHARSWIVGCLSIAILACQNSVEPAAAGLEVTASTSQTAPRMGEPIVLDVAIRNTSDRDIELPGSPVLVEVRNAAGTQVAFGQFQAPLVALPNQWIAPGETIAAQSLWTGEATVPGAETRPGRYTIRAAVAPFGTGHQHLVYSDPIELDLTAP